MDSYSVNVLETDYEVGSTYNEKTDTLEQLLEDVLGI